MKKMYIFIILSLSSFLSFNTLEAAEKVLLSQLIDEAVENNPGLKSAYEEWAAAFEKVKQVSSLPEPMAKIGYFGKNVETRVGPQEAKYGLSQKFPFPGKLKLKGDAAYKHADMMRQRYEAKKRELIKNVKFVYYDIWWVDKAIQITESEKDILSNLEKVAREKFQNDEAPQADVIKAQVDISKLIDRLFTLRQQRISLVSKMNSLLDRPKETPLGKVEDVETTDLIYSLEELHSISAESRQELVAANLAVEKAEYERSLAKLDYMPDFTFGVDYIQVDEGHTTNPSDGEDAWMGMVSVNLPIWYGKLKAEVREKEAELSASRKRLEDVENSVVYEVEDIYYKILAYKDIIDLYENGLIPQTEHSFRAAQTGYETGKVDFLNWLDAERTLLRTRLAYYNSIADYEKSMAFLERIIGKDIVE